MSMELFMQNFCHKAKLLISTSKKFLQYHFQNFFCILKLLLCAVKLTKLNLTKKLKPFAIVF